MTTKTAPPPEPVVEHPNMTAALAAFQAALPRVGKDNTAQVRSDKGNYQYRYADLAEITPAVLPLLARHGLAWCTLPTIDDQGRFILRYRLGHTSGECVEGLYPLPNPASSSQVLGSAITYARRYALCAVTGVAPGDDDDDAAAASQRQPARPAQATKRQSSNGAQRQPQAQEGDDPAEAARALLRQTCKQNKWSLDRVAALYAETRGGADLRSASMRDVEEFRQSLFNLPDRDLVDPPETDEEATP